jgi:hypothetical protein
MQLSVENADAGTRRLESRRKIGHPRFGEVEGLLSVIESALITNRKATGVSLVELFYLAELDPFDMVSAAKYVDESDGYPLTNFRSEINTCVTVVRGRLEKGDIPENWPEELTELLGVKTTAGSVPPNG